GHMLHHLHVEDDIEALALFRKRLGRLGTIINLKAAFGGMQLCHLDIERRRIRTDHVCTKPRHRLAKKTAAAADVKNPQPCEWLGRAWITAELRGHVVAYISKPDGIELVQRLELAGRIPPLLRHAGKSLDFLRIDG